MTDDGVIAKARARMEFGITQFDALHVASAIAAGADVFATADDQLLENLRRSGDGLTVPPGDALAYLEHWYED